MKVFFAANLRKSAVAVICGCPGAGKTQLARQFIEESCDNYDLICWVGSSSQGSYSKTSLQQSEDIRTIAVHLNVAGADNDNVKGRDLLILMSKAVSRYPWRIVPYLSGSMELIYSGENRAKLSQLRAQNHDGYVYSVSVFPSLGINSYFIGGNQTEFPADAANARFGAGTVVTKLNQVRRASELMVFISARSAVSGNNAQGYYQVTPPYLKTRQWAAHYSASLDPNQWGYVAPRFNNRAVAALMDGHVENFNLPAMQDMRHWCNNADCADWTLTP